MSTSKEAATPQPPSRKIYVNRELGVVTKVHCIGGLQWQVSYNLKKDEVVGILLNPSLSPALTVTVKVTDVANVADDNQPAAQENIQAVSESNRKFVFSNKTKQADLVLLVEVLQYENVRLVCCYDFSEKNTRADRVLCVGSMNFHVESTVLLEVLAFYSDYFARLFEGDFKEGKDKEVELKGVDATSFGAFLNCIFPRCKSSLTDENVREISRLADFYCSTYVKVKCADYLGDSHLSCVAKYDIVHRYGLPMDCEHSYGDMLVCVSAKTLTGCASHMVELSEETKDAMLQAFAGRRPEWLDAAVQAKTARRNP